MEKNFFPTEVEARRELTRVVLVSKHHYHAQMIKCNVLNDQRWQTNIAAKQGHFQLDRYRPIAFQQRNTVYNLRDLEWIPNATDNSWAN